MARDEDKPKHPKFVPGTSFRERWLPRIIIGGGLIAAVAAFAAAGSFGNTSGSDPLLDQAVESVFPTPGSLEPRQTQVAIDLAPGWQLARLTIDNQPIPVIQINAGGEALGQYSFVPSADAVFEAFDVGEIVVSVVVENQLVDGEIRTIEWSFTST